MSTHGLDHFTAAPPRRLFRLPSSTRTSPVTFELYQNDGEREHRIRYSECSEEDEDEDEDVEEYEDYLSPTVLSNYAAPPHYVNPDAKFKENLIWCSTVRAGHRVFTL